MEQDIASQVVGLGGATDFSLLKLFLRADFVVKFVIILFKSASFISLLISIFPYTFIVSSETLLFPSIIKLLIMKNILREQKVIT